MFPCHSYHFLMKLICKIYHEFLHLKLFDCLVSFVKQKPNIFDAQIRACPSFPYLSLLSFLLQQFLHTSHAGHLHICWFSVSFYVRPFTQTTPSIFNTLPVPFTATYFLNLTYTTSSSWIIFFSYIKISSKVGLWRKTSPILLGCISNPHSPNLIRYYFFLQFV
jgi:hypothetical protein